MGKNGTVGGTVKFSVSTLYKPTGAVNITASSGEVCSGTVNATTGDGSCKLVFSSAGPRTITAT